MIRNKTGFAFVIGLVLLTASLASAEPDWSRGAHIPEVGRANPYELKQPQLQTSVREGRLHALNYPVSITGVLIPYDPLARVFSSGENDRLTRLMQKILGRVVDIKNFDDAEAWLGLHAYPETEGAGPYFIPFKNGQRPEHRMGFTVMETSNGPGFTISCAECHSSNLFGRRVIGLTNRFPRANRAFVLGRFTSQKVTPGLFAWATGASDDETVMYKTARSSLGYIGAVKPIQLGLDTSLAHVALSLAKRGQDPWASREQKVKPRFEPLSKFAADSKPAVWWNVKYKNRWLSDGSVVSGNPIFTNILWNEIGRGTDLHDLDKWLSDNRDTIRDLTTAVFNAEAPLWTDFFPTDSIDLTQAKHGQQLFNQSCAKCHGTYQKAWDQPNAESLSTIDRLKTIGVSYKPVKPVVDVGTDPQRYQGMKSLVQLNNLEISKRNNIVIETQEGYVPPPLVGIWARWPYFHNNSAPSLCAVLTKASERPKTYWARAALNPKTDFDMTCNGYPMTKPPKADRDFFYNTKRAGLHNTGHEKMLLDESGNEKFSAADKLALIQFLQTL